MGAIRKNDYLNLKKEELSPPKNKMSQLLLSGTPALMLSQPEGKINFNKIIDEEFILLVNLANVGTIQRGVLGCFILSQFHLAALARSRLPDYKRKPYKRGNSLAQQRLRIHVSSSFRDMRSSTLIVSSGFQWIKTL